MSGPAPPAGTAHARDGRAFVRAAGVAATATPQPVGTREALHAASDEAGVRRRRVPVTGSLFDGAAGARRALHPAQAGREGLEAELVSRLAAGIEPPAARRAVVRCLDGALSARATLAQLLLATRSVSAVRELVDEITARADADSRSGDALVRDRADALTRLVVENEAAFARALAHDAGADVGAPASGAADEEAYYERVLADMLRI